MNDDIAKVREALESLNPDPTQFAETALIALDRLGADLERHGEQRSELIRAATFLRRERDAAVAERDAERRQLVIEARQFNEIIERERHQAARLREALERLAERAEALAESALFWLDKPTAIDGNAHRALAGQVQTLARAALRGRDNTPPAGDADERGWSARREFDQANEWTPGNAGREQPEERET